MVKNVEYVDFVWLHYVTAEWVEYKVAYYCVKRTVYLVDFCTVVLTIFHNLCYILLSVCFVLFSLQEKISLAPFLTRYRLL